MPKTTASFELCRLSPADCGQLLALSKSVGWPTSIETWRTFLSLPCGICYGHRTREGQIVSSTLLFSQGSTFCSLAMVLVHPDYRKLGLAGETIRRCLSHISGNVPVMLVATEYGFPVYTKFGFKTVGGIRRLVRGANGVIPSAACEKYHIEPFIDEDFPRLCELDRQACGAVRNDVLAAYIGQAAKCLMLRSSSALVGFGLCVESVGTCVLGPVIAPDIQGAELLVSHLLSAVLPVQLDIPSDKEGMTGILQSWGFCAKEELPVMLLNAEKLPGDRKNIYAIASRALG